MKKLSRKEALKSLIIQTLGFTIIFAIAFTLLFFSAKRSYSNCKVQSSTVQEMRDCLNI